ncbi:MAG TPA: radical SAM protein, partial [Candidatus Bathyarchaeia archaeon]|nr:radical SAM protein [Candidatus Bathyarchaeia archaeon]
MLALLRTLIAKALHLDRWLQPSILHLTVTNRCNSRCSACNLWQEKDQQDISLETIDRYRQSSLGKHLRILDITGGEPFLCDLPEIFRRLNNEKIKTIIISTNASLP